jgi:carboxypeptidase T
VIRRALAAYFLRPSRARIAIAAAAFVALAALAAAIFLFDRTPTRTPTRVVIRVACDDLAACELAEQLALDVWSEQRGRGLPLDVVVDDDSLARLAAAGVSYEVLSADIDADARAETARIRSARAADSADWFAEYRDYEAIAERLRELAALAPERVSLHAIGASIDGRPIWALRVGTGATPMVVAATQHAREWIAAMTATCIADRLVRDYDRDPAARAFVDGTSAWIVPVANPDGYQYSWGADRYWRKNRRDRYGVDLNRNFGVAWGGAGASKSKRSETYRGEYAFSEPESIAIRDLAKREHATLHVDLHAYGQLVMYPWSYTTKPVDDRDRYAAIGDRITSAMSARHGTRYALMQSADLYPASGTASDWFHGELGAQSWTIELRPGNWRGGRNGFVLPPEQIRPTCDEALAGVLALRAAR